MPRGQACELVNQLGIAILGRLRTGLMHRVHRMERRSAVQGNRRTSTNSAEGAPRFRAALMLDRINAATPIHRVLSNSKA